MHARIMKYIGIAIMILAHLVGYFFWDFIILGPLAYSIEYPFEESAMLRGAGILEFFVIGLSLFIMGIFREHKDK